MTTATAVGVANFSKIAKTAQQLRVSLDDVFIDYKGNVRKDYDEDEMNDLCSSIEATGGVKTPIEIVSIKDMPETEHKPYALIAGFRRCLALKDLEQIDASFGKDILATLIDVDSHAALKLSQLIENVQRVDLNPMEVAVGINDAMQDPSLGYKAVDISKMTGLSQPKISQLLKLLTLSPSIQEMIRKGEITLSHARLIAYDVPASRHEDMAKAARGMIYGEFEAEVKRMFKTNASPNGDEATATISTGKTSTQKSQQLIRAQRLKTVYLDFFTKKRTEETDDSVKALWDCRIDTVKWVMQEGETDLGKVTAEFDKELEAKKSEEEAVKKVDSNRKQFMKACIKDINDIHDRLPEEGQVRPTLAVCFAQKQQEIAAYMQEPQCEADLGFKIENIDEFMVSLHTAYDDDVKARAERAKKAAEEKAKKAAEKAKKAAEEKAAAEAVGITVSEPSDEMTDEELLADSDEPTPGEVVG